MMADASGFTRLTQLLIPSLKNPNVDKKSGAEQLFDILARFFSEVVTVIQAFNGDIVKVRERVSAVENSAFMKKCYFL